MPRDPATRRPPLTRASQAARGGVAASHEPLVETDAAGLDQHRCAALRHERPGESTWLVLLLSVEGLVRGQFFAVKGRLVSVVVILVALYYVVVDWRLVLGWGFAATGLLLLVINLRDVLKR